MSHDGEFAQLMADHRAAVQEFADKAKTVTSSSWFTPRAEGKWTPAEETRHLVLTYEALTRDLLEGKTMRLRGTPWKRRLWRVIGLWAVLWRKRLIMGVSAPRELRPVPERVSRDKLLPLFLQRVAEFEAAVEFTRAKDPHRTLTHPMMGALTLSQSLTLCAVHARHHAKFLPSVAP
jgi:hypothetical protein